VNDILSLYSLAALAVFVYMASWFIAALLRRRNDIVDIAWGPGFLVVTLVALASQRPPSARLILIAALVALWALRLALHIASRNRGKSEDFRYAAWRREWGKWFYVRTFLQVFMLQGVFMLAISAAIVVVGADGGGPLGWLDALGVGVWLLGFVFEAVGDRQLAAFIRDPANKGRLIESGLWRYTRHPNYFGEATQWWGIWLIALSVPFGWIAAISPLTITWTLLFVSGIPMLEKKFEGRPDWEAYKARTSAFLPLPPRKG
jgi:steroid 5-alpha reductase family enzyme